MSVVEADGLTKLFPGQDRPAVNGVDLRLGEGRVLALLGSNGSGKTTLIKMLSTLTRATSGEARVCGFDVATQGDAVRAHIGLVGQYAAVDVVWSAPSRSQEVSLTKSHAVGVPNDCRLQAPVSISTNRSSPTDRIDLTAAPTSTVFVM